MDVLRNQIIERKVIDLILANAVFKEVPYEIEESDVAALELDGRWRRPLGNPRGQARRRGRRGRPNAAAKAKNESLEPRRELRT